MTDQPSHIPLLRAATGEYLRGWIDAVRDHIDSLDPGQGNPSIEVRSLLAVIDGVNERLIELEQSIEKPRRARGWWPR